jgi:hypothetical protein
MPERHAWCLRRSDAYVAERFYFRKAGLSPDRTPDEAAAAAMMTRNGANAEGETDRDADAAALFKVPKPVDLDAPDPDHDVADDPLDGLTITDDGDAAS